MYQNFLEKVKKFEKASKQYHAAKKELSNECQNLIEIHSEEVYDKLIEIIPSDLQSVIWDIFYAIAQKKDMTVEKEKAFEIVKAKLTEYKFKYDFHGKILEVTAIDYINLYKLNYGKWFVRLTWDRNVLSLKSAELIIKELGYCVEHPFVNNPMLALDIGLVRFGEKPDGYLCV